MIRPALGRRSRDLRIQPAALAARDKLVPGHVGFVDFAQKVAPGARSHLRGLVSQMLLGDFDEPVVTCVVTAEVFDNRTGQAGIIVVDGHPVK